MDQAGFLLASVLQRRSDQLIQIKCTTVSWHVSCTRWVCSLTVTVRASAVEAQPQRHFSCQGLPHGHCSWEGDVSKFAKKNHEQDASSSGSSCEHTDAMVLHT